MQPAENQQVKKYTLANGLTVILDENHASPVVSLNVGVKVGSVWETDQEAGLSHLLEHMVFKGTKNYGPGEIAKIVEGSGGEINAYTSLDQTVYYINLASRYATKGLNLLSQMVFEALIDPLELEREKEVVLEEIRRGKDSPHRELSENLFKLAYPTHPYGRPVIGSEKTVKNFPRDQVTQFYKRWYAPNNMVLVICGDVTEEQIRPVIDRAFGVYASHSVDRPSFSPEASVDKPRSLVLSRPVEGTYLSLAWPIPPFTHEDIPALDLLSHLLGEGHTSRLEQIVKEKKGLVNSIHSSAFTPIYPGLFFIQAVLPSVSIDKVLEAIFEEVNFLKNHRPTGDSFERSRLNIKSSVYYEKETCEGSARKWVMYETIAGDYCYEEKYLQMIDQTTAEKVQHIAQKYLDPRKTTLVALKPEKSPLQINLKKITPKKRTDKMGPTLVKEEYGVKKFCLQNGITLLTRENHRLPLMSVYLASLGGLRFENKKNNGISQLLSAVLCKGTRTKNALRIGEINESIAGHVSSYAGRNSWGLSASFLAEKREAGLELFSDLLLNPSFEKEEVEKEKRLLLEAIKHQEDSPAHMAFQKFQALLFKKHPYGLPLLGTPGVVRQLDRNSLIAFYSRLARPSQTVISVVGSFSPEQLADDLNEMLASFPQIPSPLPKPPLEPKPTSVRKDESKKKKRQAHLVIGFQGTRLSSPDRYALEVLNNVLSGQGGRLFLELRDKNSLCYSVSSTLVEGLEPGYFAVYMGMEPQKITAAIDGILAELQKMREAIITKDELDRAKQYIIGNYEIDLQKNSAVASSLAYNELYGLGFEEFKKYPEKIGAVTAEDVLHAARKYLDLKNYSLALIRP